MKVRMSGRMLKGDLGHRFLQIGTRFEGRAVRDIRRCGDNCPLI